jgi:2-haloacid dehalogenase
MTLDYRSFEALTFDCYGTLIDWETGLLDAIGPVFQPRSVRPPDDELLEAYAAIEAELEGGPYLSYRAVLAEGLRRLAARYDIEPTEDEVTAFAESVADWPAFDDSTDALRRLARRFRLGVITNCDDDLFAASNRRLGVAFEWITTAEQVRSYKPNIRNFEVAIERIGLPRERILHVAQSLYHDHVPAKGLGLRTAWIHRRHDRPGYGATPPAAVEPDVTVPSLTAFADLALR